MLESVKPELKQCSRCHSTITLDHFETNRKGEFFKTCNNCRKRIGKDNKTYYINHKEELLEKQRIYEEQHKEERKQQAKEYREQNKEKMQQLRKSYYQNNKEQILETQKAKRDELREQMFQEHPEKREMYQLYLEREKRFKEYKKAYEESMSTETSIDSTNP